MHGRGGRWNPPAAKAIFVIPEAIHNPALGAANRGTAAKAETTPRRAGSDCSTQKTQYPRRRSVGDLGNRTLHFRPVGGYFTVKFTEYEATFWLS